MTKQKNSDLPEVFDATARSIVSRVVDLRVNKTELADLVIGEVTDEVEEEVKLAEQAFENAKQAYLDRLLKVSKRHYRGLIQQLEKHCGKADVSLETDWNSRREDAVFNHPTHVEIERDSSDDSYFRLRPKLPELSDSLKDECKEVYRLGEIAKTARKQLNNLTRQGVLVKRQITKNILQSTADGQQVLEHLEMVRKEMKSRIKGNKLTVR